MLKYAVLILWRKNGVPANFYAFCISVYIPPQHLTRIWINRIGKLEKLPFENFQYLDSLQAQLKVKEFASKNNCYRWEKLKM